MTVGLRELRSHELNAELEESLLPRLEATVRARQPGHCMRVTDLDTDLMVRLCLVLRARLPDAEIHVLEAPAVPVGVAVSSTRLVELRNTDSENCLRPPLMVFLPNEIRAVAEDSYGKATFEEVRFNDVYNEIAGRLLLEVPNGMRVTLREVFRRLSAERWPFANGLARTRYLLTLRLNDYDKDAAGAALFELGLVPDFELFHDVSRAPQRVTRNREKVDRITWSSATERGRVLELGLTERPFRAQLANFLADVGVEDPRTWARRIVTEREHWGLSFHRWPLDKDEQPEGIHVEVQDLALPRTKGDEDDDRLQTFALGTAYLPLGRQGLKNFGLTFRVKPIPTRLPALARFSVQVHARDGGLVGLVRNVAAWKTAKDLTSATFTRLAKVAWEAGWHFVRVVPLTADGEEIPLLSVDGVPLAHSEVDRRRPNESEDFWVLPDGTIEEPPGQRAVPRDASLMHAKRRIQFTALLDGRDPNGVIALDPAWVPHEPGNKRSQGDKGPRPANIPGCEVIEVSFGRDGMVNLPVPRQLKVLEQRILAEPSVATRWRMPIQGGRAGAGTGNPGRWPDLPHTIPFLEARTRYLEKVRAGPKELVSQAADYSSLTLLIVHYAEAYARLLAALLQKASTGGEASRWLADLRQLLVLDTVSLDITDHRGRVREAALIAPTHPVRALWYATWAAVGAAWVDRAGGVDSEAAVAARDALLGLLSPISFPPVLPRDDGRLLTAVDNLTPFWSLYAPSGEEDPRGMLGDVCAALGLSEPGISGTAITGETLAGRIERYLAQHPYVQTLQINAFNPGRATILADMLLALQKKELFSSLLYDVRLFVPDPDAPGVGEALLDLLSPTGNITAREADAFFALSTSHLSPKLALAIRSTAEFRETPEHHTAHLTFLFDVFPTEGVGTAEMVEGASGAAVHGLFQDFRTTYEEDDHSVAWHRQPLHGAALELPDAEEVTDLLARLPALLSAAAAAVATGEVVPSRSIFSGRAPKITLSLDAEDRALIHQVHEVSDWVVTIDRNMGIEFFDHGGRRGRPDYLIDHTPDLASNLGHRLVITSRSLQELEALLGPVLTQYGLPANEAHAVALLNQIRSLSGRLALKLISSPNQRAEVLGLALSRLYLEYQGVFRDQVLLPLDAHLELYQAMKKHADELGGEVSFKRTDLALFDIEPTPSGSKLTCRLVEVKCYSQVGDLSAWVQLKEKIAQQLQTSAHVIAHHFDPGRHAKDRPDRLVKTRELVMLVGFYLERAVRYGLMDAEIAGEGRKALAGLENGYSLDFTKSALIFDFDQPGTETAERENGIEYHRIGKDLIHQLVAAAVERPAIQESFDPTHSRTLSLSDIVLSLPKLAEAAFLVRPRTGRTTDLPGTSSQEPERAPHLSTQDADVEAAAPVTQRAADARHPPKRSVMSAVAEPTLAMDRVRHEPATSPSQRGRSDEAPTQRPSAPVELARIIEPSASAGSDAPLRPMGDERAVPYETLLGSSRSESPQYGLLGDASGRKVAIDLNETQTISLFGVQGGGKSYTLGAIAEMASLPIPGINVLPNPLATIIFHYSPTQDYRPEFTSMVAPNREEGQVKALRERYGAEPQALADVLLLTPQDKLAARMAEYPDIEVRPLKFAAAELQSSHWRFLMGAVGNQSTYIRQLNQIMKANRDALSLDVIRVGIDKSRLADHVKELAHQRMDLAAGYIDDTVKLGELIHPGRLVIVDLRDEFIEKDEALGLFVVLLQLFAEVQYKGRKFNKLVIFDEAHKYIDSAELVDGLVEVVREMRHKGTSIMVASQDPPSVPVSLIELSSQIILHKFNSPAWLKHIQKANAALSALTPERLAHLTPGEAYVWSSKASDESFSKGAIKVRCRPRVTQHGGATKTAVVSADHLVDGTRLLERDK